MTHRGKILIAGSALLILLPTLPCAAGSNSQGSQILNGQVDLHTSISNVSATVDSTGGDANVQSVAAGNALNVTTMNDTHVSNEQYTSSVDISSDLGARVTNVGGNVNVSGHAACNSADISTDPNVTQVYSNQECRAKDPSSSVYVDGWNVGGDVNVQNSAVGNTFSEDTNAPNAPIETHQINASNVHANMTANVSNVGGSVNVSGAAVGNNAQIVHY